MIGRRIAIVGVGLAAALAVPAAPRALATAAAPPRLLTSAQVPGFHANAPSTKTISAANRESCDTFGPLGGSFSMVTLSRADTSTSFGAITEGVVHTASAAAAAGTLAGVKGYVARCLGAQNGGYSPSGGRPTYTLTAHAIPALRGTGKGMEVVIRGTTTVARVSAVTVTKLDVPLIAYPVGHDLLFVVPVRYSRAHSGTTTTTTVAETAMLSAVVSKALPAAVDDL